MLRLLSHLTFLELALQMTYFTNGVTYFTVECQMTLLMLQVVTGSFLRPKQNGTDEAPTYKKFETLVNWFEDALRQVVRGFTR